MPPPSHRSLADLLRDMRMADPMSAREAAEELGKLKSNARLAVSEMVAAMKARPEICLHVVIALGRIGDAQAEPGLLHALASDIPIDRREALRALVAIGAPSVSRAASFKLFDEEWRTRMVAAKILGVARSDQETAERVRAAAIAVVDARWRGRERACPKCGQMFVAQQSRCKCPNCLTFFYASHIENPHEYPFDAPPTASG